MRAKHTAWTETRRVAATAAALAVAWLSLAAALAGPASAHASLTSSKPADRATVTEAPTEIELAFSEAVRPPATLVVMAPDGTHLEHGRAQIRQDTVTQPLDQLNDPGWYTVSYRVASDDAHPVSGQVSFMFAPANDGAAAAGSAPTAAGSAAPGGSSGSESGSGHRGHLVALGILVAAALVAAFIALRKDREYDAEPTSPGPTEAGPDGASARQPRHRRNQ